MFFFATFAPSIKTNTTMKIKIIIISLLASCTMFFSCSELSSVASQLAGMANLANCEYSLKNISNVSIAGVNLKQVTNGKVTIADAARLLAAITSKSVPLAMDVNVNVKNPTANKANVTAMAWALDIEKKQIASGNNNMAYVIEPKKTSVVPINVGTDIYSVFSNGGVEALKNFAGSFGNDGKSSRMDLRIKPSVNIAGRNISTPNYINITQKI